MLDFQRHYNCYYLLIDRSSAETHITVFDSFQGASL